MSTVQNEADAGPGNAKSDSDSDEPSSQGNIGLGKLPIITREPIRIVDILKSVREQKQTEDHADIQEDLSGCNGNSVQQEDEEGSDYVRHEGLGRSEGKPSSADGSLSTPDGHGTPSIQATLFNAHLFQSVEPAEFIAIMAWPRNSPTPSLCPFDRRLQARLSQSALNSLRAASLAFRATHSRRSSVLGPIVHDNGDIDTVDPLWEVIRWTKLKKKSSHAFSKIRKRSFGHSPCIAVSAAIAIGTSKGNNLIFDWHQNLSTIIRPGSQATDYAFDFLSMLPLIYTASSY